MTDIPVWWFVISGVYFVFSIVVLFGLAVALIRVLKVLDDLGPIAHRTAEKVEVIAGQVEEISVNVKETVDHLVPKVKGVADSAETIAGGAASVVAGYAPILSALVAALRIFQAVRGAKAKQRERRRRSLPARDEE